MNWQPIETAPKDGSWFIAYGLDCDGRGGYWYSTGLARYDVKKHGGGFETIKVAYPSHWTPLPEYPE